MAGRRANLREQELDCQKDWHRRGFHTFTGVHRILPQLGHWETARNRTREPGIHSAAYTPPARERRPQPCEASHRPACWYRRSPGCVAPCNEEPARPAGVPVPRRTHGGSRDALPKAGAPCVIRPQCSSPGVGARMPVRSQRPLALPSLPSNASPPSVCQLRSSFPSWRYFATVRVDSVTTCRCRSRITWPTLRILPLLRTPLRPPRRALGSKALRSPPSSLFYRLPPRSVFPAHRALSSVLPLPFSPSTLAR
ncbi:hypothetical protein C8R47DRAFT_264255 [Mycena vitilis]|nr:hypothetical protein C8R47DRAFT_264255 [Mycena vitilis]